ncbi:hypothetical protein FN846DRAFT_965418 [Sphaerosporella brunnea]|uniref:Uncharacterized protein n=1 Tax=Sphaerosporella brunnea TaxID=1250544 RepID=A0A5J5EKW3_9PEZI|nr:hypothetical protein FN846DRAFT_965418 [Sphaerosporella brunnea]
MTLFYALIFNLVMPKATPDYVLVKEYLTTPFASGSMFVYLILIHAGWRCVHFFPTSVCLPSSSFFLGHSCVCVASWCCVAERHLRGVFG